MDFDYENISVEVSESVATLTVDRPDALNALDEKTHLEIEDAARRLDDDADIRCVIVTGAGDRAFIAGADIKALVGYGAEEARQASMLGQRVFDRIEAMSKPVIAAINGFALGGGCELALACHIRIASDRARLGLPEINLSIIPGYGGTQRLPRLLGRARALELICTGRQVKADEAERIGLVTRVVPHDELMPTAREMGVELASKAPMAMRYALAAVVEGGQGSQHDGLLIESLYFGLCAGTDDKVEGMTAFLEKRTPQWSGR